MSTTFNVYPRTVHMPTFASLLDRSTAELHRFLESVGIDARPAIHVRINGYRPRWRRGDTVPFSLDDPLQWARDDYAWFTVEGVPGGTDAYYDCDARSIQEYWEGTFDHAPAKRLEPHIRECLSIGRCWSFRRSIGQPAIVNLAYGLIAGSLAAITDGFVFSDDSAWDWQRMPALPNEFLSWYFRPEFALEENFREWLRRCISHLAEELGPGNK